MAELFDRNYSLRMLDPNQTVLFVGAANGHGRLLAQHGIGVESIAQPEDAVTYLKQTPVPVVLLDGNQLSVDLSSLAGCLKIACPFVKVIALTASSQRPTHVDAVLMESVASEVFLTVVQQHLSLPNA